MTQHASYDCGAKKSYSTKTKTHMKIMRKGKHPRIHYFLHCINSKYREKEIIGAIDQGFTCLAAQIAQSLALEGLEDYPKSVHLINDNWKYKPQYNK
jgi:hypothetical protein